MAPFPDPIAELSRAPPPLPPKRNSSKRFETSNRSFYKNLLFYVIHGQIWNILKYQKCSSKKLGLDKTYVMIRAPEEGGGGDYLLQIVTCC